MYDKGSTKVTLDLLTTAHIAGVFGFEYIEFTPGEKTLIEKIDRSSIHAAMMSRPFFTFMNPGIDKTLGLSRLQISIVSDDGQKTNRIKEALDFTLKCVFERGIRFIGTQKDSDSGISIQSLGSLFPLAGAYKQIELNDQLLSDLVEIFNIFHETSPLPHKLETIKALLDSAMNQPDSIDVSCVLYFSVIESIYIQDDNRTELTYKLCMRLTKKLKQDIAYRDKIKTLYQKRSKVIHGAKESNVFTEKDHEFLRNLATSTIATYVKSPQDFNVKELDTMLLNA